MSRYYDLVLGIVPVTFLSVGAVGLILQVEPSMVAAIAAAITACIVGHALFVNPPIKSNQSEALNSPLPTPSGKRTEHSSHVSD